MKVIDVNDIKGFQIGQYTDENAGTGCTVILSKEGAYAGVDIRGGSPAVRETDLLKPENIVDRIHAVTLSGGSAFGLSASDGVMKYLREKECGFKTNSGYVPIVCGASLFDLSCGDNNTFPDMKMGYMACEDSGSNKPFKSGNYGAGAGALVGKIRGIGRAMKGGIGSFACEISGLQIGAVIAVNCLGDVFDFEGNKIAGVLNISGDELLDTEELMLEDIHRNNNVFNSNTTIGCIITNAKLTKPQCTKIAQVSHDGIARSIKPAHTSIDGDGLFVMSTSEVGADFDAVGALSVYVVRKAIENAVLSAESAFGHISSSDLL